MRSCKVARPADFTRVSNTSPVRNLRYAATSLFADSLQAWCCDWMKTIVASSELLVAMVVKDCVSCLLGKLPLSWRR